jgi:hypothetical protein
MSRTLRPLALAAALFSLAACSDDPAGPASVDAVQESVDLAVSAGSAIASDVMVTRSDLHAAGAAATGGAGARVGEGCTWSEASGSWTCDASRESDVDVTRTITFWSGGATQQHYDAATTDSLRVTAQMNGTFSRDGRTATVTRSRAAVVSGLTGTETQRILDATGTGTVQSQFSDRGLTRSYSESATTVTDDVVLPVAGGYPLSGTVTHDVAATLTITGRRTESRSVQRHVEVHFNGTAIVPLTVGTLECTLNLDTHRVSCAR